MINRFLIRNSLPSTKHKADAKCTLCCYRRPAIFYKLLNIKARCSPNHAMVYTENGTYTAVRRLAPHPKLCPSQIGVFFLPHSVLTIYCSFLKSKFSFYPCCLIRDLSIRRSLKYNSKQGFPGGNHEAYLHLHRFLGLHVTENLLPNYIV